MAVIGVAARRYALALFTVASEKGIAQQCLTELQGFWTQVMRIEALKATLLSPSIPSEAISRIVQQVANKIGLNEITTSFLSILAMRRRIKDIPFIIPAYIEIQDQKANRVRGELVSAGPISPGQVLKVREAIGRYLGRTLIMTQRIDPSLLGGFRVLVGDKVFDLSVQSYLSSLRSKLQIGGRDGDKG